MSLAVDEFSSTNLGFEKWQAMLRFEASAVTALRDQALQQLTTMRGLPKYLQVVQDHANCGLSCGLEKQRANRRPEF
jgi:hypothetical protein